MKTQIQTSAVSWFTAAMVIAAGISIPQSAQADPQPPPGANVILSYLPVGGSGVNGTYRETPPTLTRIGNFDSMAFSFHINTGFTNGYVGIIGSKSNGSVNEDGAYVFGETGNLVAALTNNFVDSRSIAIGPDGNWYVSGRTNSVYGGPATGATVEKFSFNGTFLGNFISGYTWQGSAIPFEIYFHNDGFMYMIDYDSGGDSKVVRFNAATGAWDPTWSLAINDFSATSLTFMPSSGNLLVSHSGGPERYVLTPTGATDAGNFTSTSAQFQIAYGPDGNLWGAGTGSTVIKADGVTGTILAFYSPDLNGASSIRGLGFVIPEPTTTGLICAGLISLFCFRRQKTR